MQKNQGYNRGMEATQSGTLKAFFGLFSNPLLAYQLGQLLENGPDEK